MRVRRYLKTRLRWSAAFTGLTVRKSAGNLLTMPEVGNSIDNVRRITPREGEAVPMARIGVHVSEGALAEAARETGLLGATKSQVLRYSALSLLYGPKTARAIAIGNDQDLSSVTGQVIFRLDDAHLAQLRQRYPGMSVSEIIRYGLAQASGTMTADAAVTYAHMKRGRKLKHIPNPG
jgi:hypothetical protein